MSVADDTGLMPPAQALTRFAPIGGVLTGTTARADRAIARYGFRAGGLGLLIAPLTASEAVPHARIAPIPRCPSWVRGVMNLRGTPVPVFDLDLALGLGESGKHVKPLVLVLDKGLTALGIAIEAPPRAVRAEKTIEVPVALPARLQPFVSSAVVDGDDVWLEFDHARLFESLRGDRAGG